MFLFGNLPYNCARNHARSEKTFIFIALRLREGKIIIIYLHNHKDEA